MSDQTEVNNLLSGVLREEGIRDSVEDAREAVLASQLIYESDQSIHNVRRMSRLAYAFESEGLTSYRLGRSQQETAGSQDPHISSFYSAMTCWLSIADNVSEEELPSSDQTSNVFSTDTSLDFSVELAFHIAATGLLGDVSAETRHHLQAFELGASKSSDWRQRLATNISVAFTLLVRKSEGWSDIETALQLIEDLRADQKSFEKGYLNSFSESLETRAALTLVGFYHLAQMVTCVGDYLRTGGAGRVETSLQLDAGRRKAIESFKLSASPESAFFADLLWAASKELIRNSLWSHIEGLPEGVQEFGRFLLDANNSQPVLELWPSQQKALRNSFLDPYRRAILVEMPTSAGKTLLAKFAIVQAKAFNDAGTIAYVVPTRALVNQITFELRQDFAKLNYLVEMAVPAFELDPSEERMLGNKIDVLVTTPEKLDLLLRVGHESVRNLTLIVADEAHNLQDGTRGARLELLLGTIKRERRNARFLLLSPFLPNGDEIVTWLGEDRALPPIQVNWRPSRRIVGSVSAVGRQAKRKLALETLSSSDNVDVRAGTSIPIAGRDAVPKNISVSSLSRSTTLALRNRGGVLVLCRGKGTAMKRASELAEQLGPNKHASPRVEAICEFIDSEVGSATLLSNAIRCGVAYHHAGLSQDVRWLVERLVSTGEVGIICGTTTLAQGVNFPISTVVVESLRKGDRTLSYSDFWNIAGRAGRALMDPLGVVAFPAESSKRKAEYNEFLKGEATTISSQLASLVVAADEIGEQFNLSTLRTYPELSSLLQFLAHAVRVSDQTDLADQMENLLRSSLIYHQAREIRRSDMDKFVSLCRAYIQSISGQRKGLLALADRTGFATPSVFFLNAKVSEDRALRDPTDWLPSKLFGDDISGLQHRVELISSVPEMRLGDGLGTGPFDSMRAASILRDWVHGAKLGELADRYARPNPDGSQKPEETRLTEFSSYLFSTLLGNASWGLGALEGLCLSGTPNDQTEEARHIPSMIYFGVRSKEAVWLRMAGVPRTLAESAAQVWRSNGKGQPESFGEVRKWISELSASEWRAAMPSHSSISVSSMQRVWRELSGTA